ncbi:MAG TPA: ABC transporter permease [Candidatus Cybelea sp.]|jgi:ABC-type polysaccharide/polyol phosphate export permease|nr:ABC transporter permease [Candidatus Cybelea sp.]
MVHSRQIASPLSALSAALAKTGAIFVRDARCALSYPAYFHSQWIAIFVEVTIAYYLSLIVAPSSSFGVNGHVGSYFTYLVVSFAFVTFQNNAMLGFAESIREGQTTGTLEAVLATPTSLSLIVLGTGVWSFTLTLGRVIVYFLLALLFGLDLHHMNWVTGLVFLVLAILSVSPIGVLAAAATMVFKKTTPLAFSVNSATSLFAGVYLPLSKLPLPIQAIGWMLPITHALNGVRAAVYGATLWDMRSELAWLVGLTAVLLPTSLYLFARTVQRGRHDGTLGQY